MRVFFDTSVLVPALVDSHPNHERVFPWLSRVIKGEVVGVISTHNLAELYSILTTIPVNRKVTTLEIYYLINLHSAPCGIKFNNYVKHNKTYITYI